MSAASVPEPVRSAELGQLRSRVRSVVAGDLGPLPVILGVAAVWIFFQTQNSNFLTSRNLSNLTLQMAVTAILAMAVVLVMVSGEIDLSMGSVTGVTSALLGILLTNHHWSVTTALLATFGLGLAIGLLHGLITVFVGVPSFIVTLGGFLAWAGVQLALIGPAGNLPVNDTTIAAIGNDYMSHGAAWVLAGVVVLGVASLELLRVREWRKAGERAPVLQSISRTVFLALAMFGIVAFLNSNFGVPYVFVLVIAVAALLGWITRRTLFGRYLYAIGGNREASRRAGIPVSAVRVSVLGLSGLLAGLAGVVSTSNLYATSANTGGSILLLEAIAAAVIGGTSLFGGRGRIYSALLGTLMIASVHNGLGLLGKPASTEQIATGVILVLAVSLDALNRRRRAALGT
ncbi:MAG: sugar ABC transporter permease [Gaiellaceae bacterium]